MEDNKDIQMLKDEIWIRRQIIAEIKIIWRNQVVKETILLEEIRWNRTKEQEVHRKLEKKDGQSWEENGIIYVDRQIYVPNNQRIKERILKENYKLVDVGHPGQQQMIKLIKRNYWWLGIKNNIKKYIQRCFKYQQNKVQHMKKAGELHPLKTPKDLWKEISIDIIGPLPKSNEKNVIIVIVNWFTKMIWLKATMINVSSEEIAKIY